MDFRDAINAGRTKVDSVKGETFTVLGVSGTFVGNINELTIDPELMAGGFKQERSIRIVCSRPQFPSDPVRGWIATIRGERFRLSTISKDDSKFILDFTSTDA